MRTLKLIGSVVILMLILPVALLLRLFGWRPNGDSGIQSLFQREPRGYAIVSGNESDVEPFPYVYVKEDGTARELHESEREYLRTPFFGADGARPYVKWRYTQKDGWGEVKGFLRRTKVPRRVQIASAPLDDTLSGSTKDKLIQFMREKGYEIKESSDGSFTATPSKMFRTDL
jgi:hypothetical protein